VTQFIENAIFLAHALRGSTTPQKVSSLTRSPLLNYSTVARFRIRGLC